MVWKIGDRVVTPDGSVGHIELLDDDGQGCDVRILTPANEPSACLSWCFLDGLTDGAGVLPQPRSAEWWREARAFHREIEAAVRDIEG